MLDFVENKYVVAIARTALVLIFFMGGFSLLTGDVPVEYAATKSVPAFAVYIGFAIKLFGGLAVIVGFQTRIAALLLVLFTLLTAFIFHGDFGNVFWKEISMIGGLLLVAAYGPGELSIDGRRASGA
ncbi:MAG TPA: DoxX family protein [Woeseiaceae bacterium]|nr:DoxX family protein [Woeseiaceae bacterium]